MWVYELEVPDNYIGHPPVWAGTAIRPDVEKLIERSLSFKGITVRLEFRKNCRMAWKDGVQVEDNPDYRKFKELKTVNDYKEAYLWTKSGVAPDIREFANIPKFDTIEEWEVYYDNLVSQHLNLFN